MKIQKVGFANLTVHKRNILILIASSLCTMAIGIVARLCLAHYLSKEEMGGFFLAGSIVGACLFLGLPGLGTASIAPMARGNLSIYRKLFRFRTFGTFCVMCVALIVTFVISRLQPEVSKTLNILVVYALLCPWLNFTIYNDYLTSQGRFALLFLLQVGAVAVSLLAVLISISFNANTSIIAISYLLPNITIVIIASLIIFCKKKKCQGEEEKGWIKFGIVRSLLSGVNLIVGRIDKIIVGVVLSLASLASVGFGEFCYNLALAVTTATEKAYVPKLAQIESRQALWKLRCRHALILFVLFAIVGICGLFALPYVVKHLLPAGYEDVTLLGRVYIIAWLTSLPGLLLPTIVLTRHLSRVDVRVTTTRNIVRIISLAVFTYYFGVVGVPMSRVSENLTFVVLLHFKIRKYCKEISEPSL